MASTHSAYQTVNATSSSLLYFASNLTFANHNLVLRNLGAVSSNGDKGGNAFLLDYLSTTIQLAPAGCVSIQVTCLVFSNRLSEPLCKTKRIKKMTPLSLTQERGGTIPVPPSVVGGRRIQTRTKQALRFPSMVLPFMLWATRRTIMESTVSSSTAIARYSTMESLAAVGPSR